MEKAIYLDNAATTPVKKEVVNEVNKYLIENYGNPSSVHQMGEEARKAIDDARLKISKEINSKASEIVFTSGATEADNLAILGLARANPKRKKIIISAIEHPAVYEPCMELKKRGYDIVEIKVDEQGILDFEYLEKEINNKTLLVSVMHVNNEIGAIQDIAKIGVLCKRKNVIFHSDAAQSFGKLEIDVKKINIGLLSASGHKIGGPKGIGFLFIKEGIKLEPLIYGGGQEKGIRSGTENVAGIMGFAKALEIMKKTDKEKIRKIRDLLKERLEKVGGKVNGSFENRIYNNLNISFPGTDGEQLMIFLSMKGIYVSTGSACASRKKEESRTLIALGLSKKEIDGSLRITLNEEIKEKDAERIVKETEKAIKIAAKNKANKFK